MEGMERLKAMKESLMGVVEGQIHGHLGEVDAEELGEAVDMIKDLSEAIYYCTITKAMEDGEKEGKKEKEIYHYTERIMPPMENYPPPMMGGNVPIDYRYDPGMQRMYYGGSGSEGSSGGSSSSGGNSGNGSGSGTRNYSDAMRIREGMKPDFDKYPTEIRDYREGKSPVKRRNYMESKEMHKDKTTQMHELEQYMQELSTDITEMISDASPEEKAVLQQKLNILISKIK